jgi:hypothetical protein
MISMRGGFLCVWTGKLHGFVPWILVKNCYRQTTIQLNEFPNKKPPWLAGLPFVCRKVPKLWQFAYNKKLWPLSLEVEILAYGRVTPKLPLWFGNSVFGGVWIKHHFLVQHRTVSNSTQNCHDDLQLTDDRAAGTTDEFRDFERFVLEFHVGSKIWRYSLLA